MNHISLINAFRDQVRTRGEHIALIVEADDQTLARMSWRSLAQRVDQTAAEIKRQLARRDRAEPSHVGHLSTNGLDDILVALASMSLGTIEFPFDHRLSDDEIVARWNRIGGVWHGDSERDERIVSEWHSRRSVEAGSTTSNTSTNSTGSTRESAEHPIPNGEGADSAALVLWTSGTTGTPRGVTLSSRNLLGNASAKLKAVPQTTDDIRLCVLPLSHAYARTCDFGTWLLSGCQLAVTFGYAGLQRLAPLVRPTVMNVVPSIANRMLGDRRLEGLEQLRLLGCGGAAMAEPAFERWKQRGVTVIQGYGLTETSPVICSATPDDAMPGRVGRLVDGWESMIRDGQLFVRGPHVMMGYWDEAAATAERIDSQGWLRTGDLVEFDPSNGQAAILGRADDVIVLESARKIHPTMVEQSVTQIDGVLHAILVRREGLELWFDEAATSESSSTFQKIRTLLDSIDGLRSCSIQRFESPLSQEAGELTMKGTIRRSRILETRFSNHAGS